MMMRLLRSHNILRMITLLLASQLTACALAQSAPQMAALAGRYDKHFKSSAADTGYDDDVLEIVPITANSTYVRIHTATPHGSICGFSAVFWREQSDWVYRAHGTATAVNSATTNCVLKMKPTRTAINFEDVGGECRAYCGAGNDLETKGLFLRSSRRRITYLPRLRLSHQYLEALAQNAAK